MPERDWRKDPRPGDVSMRERPASDRQILLEVLRAHGGFVLICQDNGFSRRKRFLTMKRYASLVERYQWLCAAETEAANGV